MHSIAKLTGCMAVPELQFFAHSASAVAVEIAAESLAAWLCGKDLCGKDLV